MKAQNDLKIKINFKNPKCNNTDTDLHNTRPHPICHMFLY